MTALHRFLVFGALAGLVAWISTPTQGEPTPGKTRLDASVKPITPTQPSAQKPRDFEAEMAASKFAAQPVHVYEPLEGPLVVGMQIKPELPAAPARPRDYLILISTSAAQAGAGWIGSNQIADGLVQTARDGDRIALWTVGDKTEAVVDFVNAKADAKTLETGLKSLARLYPSGTADLKTALNKAASAFSAEEGRQRIVLFLGDGQSTQNPLTHDDRAKISDEMVRRQIAFFAVPLGLQLDADNLHGFATGTGGAVLRTRVNEEKLVDALKRYQEAFAAPILYDAKLQLPAEVIESYPQRLPPMRGDTPTLIVGRMNQAKSIRYTVTGMVAGLNAPTTATAAIAIPEPDLDNFFLMRLADQWAKAKTRPALLRGDRALTLAYNQTKVEHLALLVGAQLAMERNEFDGATRLFGEAKKMSPRDPEAAAGLQVVARLKDGTLTREALRNQLKRARVGEVVKKENGEVKITQTNFVALAQEPVAQPNGVQPNGAAAADQLQQQRDRMIIEEQKMAQLVEEAMRDARRELALDPDGAVEMLRNTLVRVEDHPEIGDRVRDTLAARLQTALREASAQGRLIKMRQEQENRVLATIRERQEREAERRTFEDRQILQFRRFKDAMARARFEEQTKNELLAQMIALENEAHLKGLRPPVVAKVMYDQTQAQFNLQRAHDLRRLREERFLQVLLEVEKSHVPFPDEPGIFYPPLATWKAITAMRKEKYEVSSLPDDDKARAEANALSRMLDELIDMQDFQQEMTLKEALGLFYEIFQKKNKELPILIDQQAFKLENPDAPDLYETSIKFPPYPKTMTMATALKLALSQVPTSDATYLVRRSFIEITTFKRAIEDRVLRVYPVGELVIPISQQGGLNQFQTGGAQFGGGFGALGGGGFQGIGGFGGGIGGFGGGIGGFGGGIGGIGGGIGGLGGGQGFIGGQITGSFQGGSFQGGFNGSLGQLGASQAVGLIDLITKVVDPGNWFYTQQAQPFNPTNFAQGFINPFGGGGNLGAPMGGFGNLGGGAPPPPVSQGGPADLQNSNTIEFFPPALALIVRAPSRVHTSITGGVIGGKYERPDEFARRHAEQRNLAMVKKGGKIEQPALAGANNNKPKVLAQAENLPGKGDKAKGNKGQNLDPKKIWEEAFAKGGIEPALVVATADFLFETGKHDHVAEFLKANLRHGVIVRPWVYEALAVALEQTEGDPDEIRRARLSAIALDPNDTEGFLEAARAMAAAKQYDRALAFCRQAALLEPSLAQTYVDALAYAQDAKDIAAMEWAAREIVSQDWPVDNQQLHTTAQNRVEQLARTLRNEQRGSEADRLRAALQMLKERDLVVVLSWDAVTGEAPAGIELQVKEPTGSVCSLQQKQTPGGGALLAPSLKEPNRATYAAALAFPGEYEISVRRLWGQTLGSRARLEIIQHLGTPKETRKLHIVRFDSTNTPVKVTVADGRRTELATVSPANLQRKQPDRDRDELKDTTVLQKLRNMAFPDFSGASTSGGARVRGTATPPASRLAGHSATAPARHSALRGGTVQMTSEVRTNANGRELDMVLRPMFQTVPTSRPGASLPGIPGGL